MYHYCLLSGLCTIATVFLFLFFLVTLALCVYVKMLYRDWLSHCSPEIDTDVLDLAIGLP